MGKFFKMAAMFLIITNNAFCNTVPSFVGKYFTANIKANKNLSLTVLIAKEKSNKLKILIKQKDQKVLRQVVNEVLFEDVLDIFSKQYMKNISLNNLEDGNYELSIISKNESYTYSFEISTQLQKAQSYRVLE